jgi:UDP-hydrolysing UDP-N-acetyl-D-glucosamine 2-epimerase
MADMTGDAPPCGGRETPGTHVIQNVGIITTTRADYGIYRPLLSALRAAEFNVTILAGGTHPLPRFGRTLDIIHRDGLGAIRVVEHVRAGDRPPDMAHTCGGAIGAFADALSESPLDLVFALGDRAEMVSAAMAAVLLNIPLAHLHGGDATEGAQDEQFRHALTKLAHVHFPALPQHAARISRMGEEAWRVHTVGALALDELCSFKPIDWNTLTSETDFDSAYPTLVVSFHPETLSALPSGEQVGHVIAALDDTDANMLLIGSNADAGHLAIGRAWSTWAARRPRTHLVPSLDQRAYWSWLHHANALVGNSSSGVIEASSLALPAINIGDRQAGRIRAGNVVDARCDADDIRAALQRANDPAFRASLTGMANPYGDGHAAHRILDALRTLPDRNTLLRKRFADFAP